ncbi:4-hydroxy-tetrahydrodipicolinate reductase [Verrucomicrobiaceae bacterium R5-34]|uniref:4-hydroxy-tetrahydrodipicolinate reductase n=1 Tax=Oceaniferula flava TaxID=2800421 RepID=A0AAE2SAE0_9BACT|nr:4-hydroxy-tetrahydrodipicolinate reductase [Oceaniferula flavus]MBK1830343.1 4-hydroxy-tetrahydrodipicolinate reductase [Verrucomicrobiaceae bacterium R5-34]MBK1854435.1 4-hydroxy-tetrahydrodipicolinate reductase [Oceaniferula flavus]MBM1135741.1 4-hydroxy-tetrahydrodipicolinate reductase [Oceaniferula flavus]
MTKLLITGRSGRMGQTLIEAGNENPDTEVTSTHDSGDDLTAAFQDVNAAIDFTVHHFTGAVLDAAMASNTPLVIGTTGHTDEEREAIVEASKSLPIVFAPNYSVGVNTLFYLTRKAAQILGNDRFDIEVTEMHHRHKIDAPSGTARRLLEILNEETGTSYKDDIAHGRVGNIGARPSKEIGMHTLRGGDVVGDHTVMFAADGERVELTHKASSRMTFASGAVRAAVWLQDQPAGLYDMQDVLGLK